MKRETNFQHKMYTFWLPNITDSNEIVYGQCNITEDINNKNYIINDFCITTKKNEKFHLATVSGSDLQSSKTMYSKNEPWDFLLYYLSLGKVNCNQDNSLQDNPNISWAFDPPSPSEPSSPTNFCKIALIDSSSRFKKLLCRFELPLVKSSLLEQQASSQQDRLAAEVLREMHRELEELRRNNRAMQTEQLLRETLETELERKRQERDKKTVAVFLAMLNSKKKTIWKVQKKNSFYKNLLRENNVVYDHVVHGNSYHPIDAMNTLKEMVTDTEEEMTDIGEIESFEITDSNSDDESFAATINQFANTQERPLTGTENDMSERVKYNKADPFASITRSNEL